MNGDYEEKDIEVLEGREHVRKRPSMYIGSTSKRGINHLVHEVLDNSIDEALAGFCDEITVNILDNNYIEVKDNGRGIPVDKHPEEDRSTVEVVLTKLHAGGKFDEKAYETSGGLHGVGVSVVNFLSDHFVVEIKRDGYIWYQEYRKGIPQTELRKVCEIGKNEEEKTGTRILFKPDETIFDETEIDFSKISSRIREAAFLNEGVRIIVQDKINNEKQVHHYEGGVVEFVEYLNRNRDILHDDIISIDKENDIQIRVGIQYTSEVSDVIHSYVNAIPTTEGGTHLTGFKSGLTRSIKTYSKNHKNQIEEFDGEIKSSDLREGITAIISVRHPDPQFEGQTKRKLGNSEVRGEVNSMVYQEVKKYLEANPTVANKIIEKAIKSAEARKAAQKAQEATRRKNPLSSTGLPGKLSDCETNDPEKAELYIVEGDSAGGSARQARDPKTQAILPLKGKILNVEKHRINRLLENDEINSMINAIGGGVGDEFSIDDVRYRNIIISTDADVDGAHIRTLLLTFFYRYMRPLIKEGCVYSTKPPLYRIKYKGETYDVMTKEEKEELLEELGVGEDSVKISRFKGLGEMTPEQLWETTMDPENRILKQITLEDASRSDATVAKLMGKDTAPRKKFIKSHAKEVEWVDI